MRKDSMSQYGLETCKFPTRWLSGTQGYNFVSSSDLASEALAVFEVWYDKFGLLHPRHHTIAIWHFCEIFGLSFCTSE